MVKYLRTLDQHRTGTQVFEFWCLPHWLTFSKVSLSFIRWMSVRHITKGRLHSLLLSWHRTVLTEELHPWDKAVAGLFHKCKLNNKIAYCLKARICLMIPINKFSSFSSTITFFPVEILWLLLFILLSLWFVVFIKMFVMIDLLLYFPSKGLPHVTKTMYFWWHN